MSSAGLKITLVCSAVVVAVALFMLPSQVNIKPKADDAMTPVNTGFDYPELIKSAKTSLNEKQNSRFTTLETSLAAYPDSLSLYDSIGKAWDMAGIPAISAYYFDKKAEKFPGEKNYLEAAYRYFDAYKIAGDTTLRSFMAQQAISSYKKVLAKNPSNLNAKTDLGVCYAETTSDPMRGITLLREVVAADPEHEMAQLNLGLLSLKSTQYAKAIERFNKVLAINPARTDVYLYLGETYIQMSDTANAVKVFEKYKIKSDNYEMVQQVSKLLSDLKNSKVVS